MDVLLIHAVVIGIAVTISVVVGTVFLVVVELGKWIIHKLNHF